MIHQKHLCIAPQHSRRAQFWEKALAGKQEPMLFLTYLDVIADRLFLEKDAHYIVRLESPGEDFETYKAILLLGCTTSAEREKVVLLKENFGEISNFDLWNKGWKRLLLKIDGLRGQYQLSFLNTPTSIAILFEKRQAQQLLQTAHINCPFILEPCSTYEALLAEMSRQSLKQVFIKPTSGSSASGVMAFRYLNPNKQALYTTVVKKEGKFYNSLHLQRYHLSADIEELINHLCNGETIIEKWIPKWSFQGLSIDFRVVVIAGKAEFVVPRGSKHMITNLHLGNQKLTESQCGIDELQLQKIKQVAEEALNCFPNIHYAGIDVLLDRKGKNAYVLELNAFGDMLLNISNPQGESVYDIEYRQLFDDGLLR